MKKYSPFFILLLMAMPILLSGCGDNFLNVEPRERVALKDHNSTYTPGDFITGVYGGLTALPSLSYVGITGIISDNALKGSNPTDSGGDMNLLNNFSFTTSSSSVRAMWKYWYKDIGRATYAINYTKDFEGKMEVPKSRLIGQAKFLRAFDYFNLVRYWGDVPIQSKNPAKRAPKDSVYALIIQDLKYAESNLPLKSEYPPEDLGRVTKGAARTLLAKVYLEREQWQKALKYAQKVIDTGEYALYQNYYKIFRESGENGIGSIFEIQARGKNPPNGIFRFSLVQAPRGAGGWGWGFNVPSESLVHAFEVAGDSIRKDATIMFGGETLWDGQHVSPNAANPRYNQKAYSTINRGSLNTGHNKRVLRYAGVLFVKAEAAAELGQLAKAKKALNKVRARVDLSPITTQNKQELLNAIYRGHRLEFAMEGDRWFFLLRTGRTKQAIMDTNNAVAKTNFDKHYTLFPIPIVQLRKTPNMRQNPGY